MVRTSDLSEASLASFATYSFVAFDEHPWVKPLSPKERRVALVSTAGIHAPNDEPFAWNADDWRSFPSSQRDFHCSHVSVNFDRSGFAQDPNVALPLDRLEDLAKRGAIGSVAPTHYSFMGGTPNPELYEHHARTAAESMKCEGVNTVVLAPV